MPKVMELDQVVVWDGNMAACQAMRQANEVALSKWPAKEEKKKREE